MSGTSARTLELLAVLQSRHRWSGAELAARLEVPDRTLRRDVQRLRDLGYEIEASRGTGGGYRLANGAALPPLVVTADEAVALVVGLGAAASAGADVIAASSVGALAKVLQILPDRLRVRAEALARTTDQPAPATGDRLDPHDLMTLAECARREEVTTFAYVAADGTASDREVQPHTLVRVGRRWYLAAYDRHRADWRTFRLDRLRDVTPTGTRFTPREPPGGDAAEYVRRSVRSPAPVHHVRLVVDAPAETVGPAVGRWVELEPLGADRTRVVLETDDLMWAAVTVIGVGAEVEVEGPDELRAYLADVGRRLGRAARR